MRCPALIPEEPLRLRALAEYGLDGAHQLPALEPIVRIAAQAFGMPEAAVNMIGSDEVFFAASFGIGEIDMRREVSFCAHVVTQRDVLIVEDALLDERFHDNPLVTAQDGIRFYAGAPILHPEGHAVGVLCVIDTQPRSFSDEDARRLEDMARLVTDKLELRRIEFAGQSGWRTYEHIAMTSPNGIISFGPDGVIKALNRAAQDQFGLSPEQAIGTPLVRLLPAWRDGALANLLAAPAAAQAPVGEDTTGRHATGREFPVEAYWSAWMEGAAPNFGVVVRDVTERRAKDEAIYALANFDAASGLANRARFEQQLEEAISQHPGLAVLAIDIPNLDELADTLGHVAGDAAFAKLADRARASIRPTDVLARLGPGKMGLLLPGITDAHRAAELAERLLAAIALPLLLEQREVRYDANCGIALYPAHGGGADELIGGADLALREAHRIAPGSVQLFAPALRTAAIAKGLFEAEIHRAVQNGELELHYQPQMRLADGALVGAEALIRWNHPERGLLSPAEFLPAAEDSGLAAEIGRWVIDTACRQAAEWRSGTVPHFRMSVNLFGAQLRDSNLRTALASARERHDLPAGALELEITETTALADHGQLLPLFRQLHDDGLELAFDDFGTGFASLSLLASYPLTHLKIDKSFVQNAPHDPTARAIVRAITDLAHNLGLNVIAEGVETEQHLEACRELGCDEVQGFLIGRPVPAAQLALR